MFKKNDFLSESRKHEEKNLFYEKNKNERNVYK